MRVAVIQRKENLIYNKTAHDRDHEEDQCFEDHGSGVGIRRLKANDKREHHDTDDVVDDRRADDRGPDLCLDLAKLLQGGYGDADAGGGHDRTDKDCLIEFLAAPGSHAVKRHI